jgi:hypothetical protein
MKVPQAKHFQTVLVTGSKGKAREIQNIEITYVDESLL